ncbi:caspase domain-containing protein [Spirosoma soli]|uniref:Caspase domain-containing protein n=1 Tax=Spirosoma soli TaxID=1770529 RepID=A0ABW5M660_9BACT
MKTLLPLLIIGSLMGAVFAQSPPAEKRLALIIGNGTYTQHTPLPKALNDADDMVAILTRLGFEVLLHKNLNKEAMQKAVSEFTSKLAGYPVGLVYYAGHGIEVNGLHFMAPIDAGPTNAADVEQMCLMTNQLINGLKSAKAKTNIIILDTDRTNPFERSFTRTATNPLNDLDTPIGFVVAYATSPGRAALEGTGRNGLYTGALLKAMTVPNQTLIQMFRAVRADVIQQSNNRQIPWELTSLTGDFYFSRK